MPPHEGHHEGVRRWFVLPLSVLRQYCGDLVRFIPMETLESRDDATWRDVVEPDPFTFNATGGAKGGTTMSCDTSSSFRTSKSWRLTTDSESVCTRCGT